MNIKSVIAIAITLNSGLITCVPQTLHESSLQPVPGTAAPTYGWPNDYFVPGDFEAANQLRDVLNEVDSYNFADLSYTPTIYLKCQNDQSWNPITVQRNTGNGGTKSFFTFNPTFRSSTKRI